MKPNFETWLWLRSDVTPTKALPSWNVSKSTLFTGSVRNCLGLVPIGRLPPDFNLLEEMETDRLQKEAVEAVRQRLNQITADNPVRQALVRRLVRLNNDWPRLAAELQGLVARRIYYLILSPWPERAVIRLPMKGCCEII